MNPHIALSICFHTNVDEVPGINIDLYATSSRTHYLRIRHDETTMIKSKWIRELHRTYYQSKSTHQISGASYVKRPRGKRKQHRAAMDRQRECMTIAFLDAAHKKYTSNFGCRENDPYGAIISAGRCQTWGLRGYTWHQFETRWMFHRN